MATPRFPSSLRAIFFDACGVLYRRSQDVPRLKQLLAAHRLPLATPEEVRTRCQSVRARAFIGQASVEEYLEATLTAYGLTDSALREKGRRLLMENAADIVLFDGVTATLTQLRSLGLKLGVITDTAHPTADKLRWLAKAGLSIKWDAFVSSCEIGIRKPDPRVYDLALEQAKVQASQAAFVGHSAAELRGAAAAGLTTIAYDWDEGAQADFYLSHFCGLVTLVGASVGPRAEG